jgi:hypothetical protein
VTLTPWQREFLIMFTLWLTILSTLTCAWVVLYRGFLEDEARRRRRLTAPAPPTPRLPNHLTWLGPTTRDP